MSLSELADLIFRWLHLIAGIMWIGNSMLFNWLDRNLVKPAAMQDAKNFQGEIWMVHSGAFYEVRKLLLEPNQLPDRLHWFKWQNGITWLSGISLLVVVYYFHDGAFLIDPAVAALSFWQAVALSAGSIVGAWLLYDLLWRGLGRRAPKLAGALSLALLAGMAILFTQSLSGRAAYLHVGVLMGTLMTGNVWFVILPSQRELIAATKAGRDQDKALSLKAKERSIHNNYMTFPLLFIMLSQHFPSTYGNARNWTVLLVLMVASAGIRHFMNIRFGLAAVKWLVPAVALFLGGIVGTLILTARPSAPVAVGEVSFARVKNIIAERCHACHAAKPTDTMFPVPPGNVMFDTPEQIQAMAARIKDRVVINKTMPFINRTGMSDDERALLGRWVDLGAPIQ